MLYRIRSVQKSKEKRKQNVSTNYPHSENVRFIGFVVETTRSSDLRKGGPDCSQTWNELATIFRLKVAITTTTTLLLF